MLFRRTCVFAVALLCAAPAMAQVLEPGRWEPMGPSPVDQAGAGRRGYSMTVEGTDVTDPHANQVTFHMVGANNFYIEHSGSFEMTERSETHTLAFEYRRGFKPSGFPRFEIGAQIQIDETDAGMLNGFIAGFEDMVNRPLRSRTAPPPPGTSIALNGRQLYSASGTGSGMGDVSFVAKAALRDADKSSNGTRVAARLVANISGTSQFTEGNFVGVGLGMDRKLGGWFALHGDIRGNVNLDRVSAWGLPLSRGVFGFSVGPELKITQNNSLNLQWDGSTSPYLPAGFNSIDSGYGDIVLGANHRFVSGSRLLVAQFYARENMMLPFSVRWNADPDFAVGFKLTVH